MAGKARKARGERATPGPQVEPKGQSRGTSTTRATRRAPLPIIVAAVALVVVLAGLGVLALLSSSLASVGASAASPLGRISFVRMNSDSTRDLYVVNPDGSHQERVTTGVMIEGANEWSPDGRQILAQATINGVSTVTRMDIGTDNKASNAVQLTADVKADSALPVWSPDGTQVAFQSKRDGGDYQVFVMDKNGNNKRRASGGKGYAGQPGWSPDGKQVIYVQGDKSDPGSPKEIYSVAAAGGTPKKLTSLGKDLSSPQWSPDGKTILFVANQGDRASTIYVANSDGTNPHVVVDQGANRNPRFSPDGSKILYWAVSTGSSIYIVPTAGGPVSDLAHLSSDDYEPTWSPDGKMIAWAGKRGDTYHIVVSNTEGTNQKEVSSGSGSDYQPTWGKPLR